MDCIDFNQILAFYYFTSYNTFFQFYFCLNLFKNNANVDNYLN